MKVLSRFREDDDNLSAALAWAATEAPAVAVRLAANWRLQAATMRRFDELRRALELLVDGPVDQLDTARCRVLLGGLNYQQGRTAIALPLLTGAVPILSSAAPTEDLAVRGWCWLAVSHLDTGDTESATKAADEALRLGRQAERRYLESTSLDLSSFVAQRTGRLSEARSYIEEGLALDRLRGDSMAVLHSTVQLAEVLTQMGDTSQALESIDAVLAASDRGEASEWLQLSALRVRGRALWLSGETNSANQCLSETLARWDAAGAANEAHEELLCLAAIRRCEGDSSSAARIVGMAETYRDVHRLSDGDPIPYVAEHLDHLLAELGEPAYLAEVHQGQGVDRAGVIDAALRELAT
jgi:tetratricopeptide (TPR) repeat protein